MGQSDFISKAASFVLENAAKGILSKAAGDLFEKGLHAIFGGGDTEAIINEIHKVFEEVKQVKQAVEKLSQNLEHALFVLRSDNLFHDLIPIETLFNSVNSCMVTASDFAKKKDHSEKDLTTLQEDLERHLKDCIDKIPTLLDQVNHFLGANDEDSFVRLSAEKALKESSNLIGYYARMKIQFMCYWAYTIKGITLLQMAQATKNVNWLEGPRVIPQYTDQLREQESLFRKTIGENTCQLVELIVTTDDWQRPVKITVDWGAAISLRQVNIGPWGNEVDRYEPYVEGSDHQKWRLDPGWVDKGAIRLHSFREEWNPFGDFRIFITARDLRQKGVLYHQDPFAIVSTPAEAYYIKPVAVGDYYCRVSRERDSGYLYVAWDGQNYSNRLGFDDVLHKSQENDDHYRWYIVPWKD